MNDQQLGAEPQAAETHDPRDQFWVKRASDMYSASSNYFDLNVRNRIIEDIRQFQGEHRSGSKYFTNAFRLRSKLFRPKTRAAIRKNEAIAAAAFFASEDVVAVRPANDANPLSVASASVYKQLLQYRLTRPYPHGVPWFLTCIGAYQESQAVGVVTSVQRWQYDPIRKLDRPEVVLVPVENARFDAAADWRDPVNSSPYFIITWPMYVKDIKSRMSNGDWKACADGVILSASRPAADTIRLQREKGTDSKDQKQAITDHTVVWVHENFEHIESIGDVVYYTLGTQHLLTTPVLVTDKYPQGRPIVVGFSIIEAHKNYPASACQLTRDIQEEINEVANSRIDAVKQALNPRYFVKKGSQTDLNSLVRNAPGSITLTQNPQTDVKVVTTDDARASSYQEQDRLNLDFDDLSGAFSGSSVASNRNLNETVGGMNIISSNANQVSEYQLRTFTETWVEPVLRQVILLERAYEDDATVLEVCGSQADLTQQGFKGVTLDMLEQDVLLTVNVGTGAVNPQTQVDRFLFGLKALATVMPEALQGINKEEVIKELFGKLGYKDGLRFWRQPEQEQPTEDPRLAQMAEMIQKLQAALAAKNPPEVVTAQVAKLNAETALAEVKAINERVAALFAAMQTAQTAVTVPGVTPVADAIVQSAGFIDQNAPPVYPQTGAPQVLPQTIPQNTSPMFPANPQHGMMTGYEGGQQ